MPIQCMRRYTDTGLTHNYPGAEFLTTLLWVPNIRLTLYKNGYTVSSLVETPLYRLSCKPVGCKYTVDWVVPLMNLPFITQCCCSWYNKLHYKYEMFCNNILLDQCITYGDVHTYK